MTSEVASEDGSESIRKKRSSAVENCAIKPNDRVQRKSQPGRFGVVQDVREEITAATVESSEKGLLVSVLWDSGTYSYLVPEALELVR